MIVRFSPLPYNRFMIMGESMIFFVMPPQDGDFIENTNLGLKVKESLSKQWFCKIVSKLIRYTNVRDTKRALTILISNKVKIQRNILHAGMKDEIYTKIYYTNIITLNDRGGG